MVLGGQRADGDRVALRQVRKPALLAAASSSRLSSYAARKPGNVTTVPLAVKSVATPSEVVAARRKVVVATLASVIWEAMVRFHRARTGRVRRG